jgi:hypothetical protein
MCSQGGYVNSRDGSFVRSSNAAREAVWSPEEDSQDSEVRSETAGIGCPLTTEGPVVEKLVVRETTFVPGRVGVRDATDRVPPVKSDVREVARGSGGAARDWLKGPGKARPNPPEQ